MNSSQVKEKILALINKEKKPDFSGVADEWWTAEGVPRKRRIIIVYNPRSSKAQRVVDEVVSPIQKISGVMVGKYEVRPTDVDDNAEALSKILLDGDIVISAGGDGTATIGLNGAMLSKREVRFMALPFGNFNDMARTMKQASGEEFYPLEMEINGEHYRYAACYFTIGMFAESTEVFDEKKTRKKLQTKDRRLLFSIFTLAGWYFKNKKRRFIPAFEYVSKVEKKGENGISLTPVKRLSKEETVKISDYIAVNGVSVAKIIRSGEGFYKSGTGFLSVTRGLGSFLRLSSFMARSMFKRIPGAVSVEDILTFPDGGDVMVQAEGEYKRILGVKEIVIKKSKKPIKIL